MASTGIAIIGMAGRFPGARNLHEFWQNLRNGVECIAHPSDADFLASGIPADIWRKPNYVRAAATVEHVDRFDAAFFGITPREAEILDPQQRLALECAWEAFEDAGYDPETCGVPIGVYAGAATSSYLGNLYRNPEVMRSFTYFQLMLANDKDHLATRLAYKLDLRGPAVGIQTACSTSLVAVHVACEALISRQCDLAIAAGVMIRVSPFGDQEPGYLYEEGGITSSDGRCCAFDAAAQGTVFGNGIGVVLLKRLSDAVADNDHIHAVIKGSAVNNDGAARVGYAAPSVDGQAKVIAEALAISGVDVDTIGHVEAHGTGTPLGDPIEVLALSKAYRARTARRQFCAIGSVKPNVGHLETAAGMAGLIKTVLALKHREIPPLLHFERSNPAIDFSNSPFYVPTELRSWPDTGAPLRAGVSSFGMGGTNAHIILEEAPAPISTAPPLPPLHLLHISARSPAALEALTARIAIALAGPLPGTIADIAFTLRAGRRSFCQRRMIVCRDAEDARDALATMDQSRVWTGECLGNAPRVAFLLSGEDAQYIGMGRELYEAEPVFRQELNDGAKLLNAYLGLDLRELLYPAPQAREEASAMLSRTAFAQPVVFLVEYALARTIMRWGIQPDALLGHGVGELVAATLSGVFSVNDALALVAARGRIMQELPAGAMVAVALPHAEVRAVLGSRLAIAAINGPDSCVVSGPVGTISALESRLESRGVRFRRLETSHAFHSPMMDPAVAKFTDCVARVERKPPTLRFIANVTGSWITPSQAVDPAYWGRQLRECVLFSDGLRAIADGPACVLVEVGPGHVLSNLTRGQLPGTPVIETMRGRHEDRSDFHALLSGIGKLWLSGVSIHPPQPQPFRRVPLPSYPFERQRYWIDPVQHPASLGGPGSGSCKLTTPVWMISTSDVVAQPPVDLLLLGTPGDAQDRVMNAVDLIGNDDAVATSTNPLQNAFPIGSRPATTSTELGIARIWKDLLGVDRIFPSDRFFDLGGDSLTATQIATRLREQFGIDLPLKEVLSNPSVRSLAARIDGGMKLRQAATPLGREVRDGAIPLSFAQQRLFILDNLAPGNPFYNVAIAVDIQGSLNTTTLARSVEAVAQRHEVLRTTFEVRDSTPAQIVHESLPPEFTVLDLQDWSPHRRDQGAQDLLRQEARRPFSLLRGPMVRVLVLRLTAERTTVVFTMHHIAVDAWSLGIFLREVAEHYTLLSEQQLPALEPVLVQYADFAIWQRRTFGDGKVSADMSYWTTQLAGAPDLKLRFARTAPVHPTFAGAQKIIRLAPSVAGHLEMLARAEGATLFMVLLTAFQIVLRHHSGLDDIVVGTDVANRRHAETERLIGFFVNQVVLRTDLSGNPSFIEILRRVRRVALEAFEHQDLPFDKLVEAMNPPRDARGMPLFQIKFVLQNAPVQLPSLNGLRFTTIPVENGTAKFDLLFNCERTSEGVFGLLEYSTEVFDPADIARLLADFELVVETAARSPEASLLQVDTTLADMARQRHATAQQAREVMKRRMLANASRRPTALNPEEA